MNTKPLVVVSLLSSILGAGLALGAYLAFFAPENPPTAFARPSQPVKFTSAAPDASVARAYGVPEGLNFLAAASRSTPSVVHIKVGGPAGGHSELLDMFRDDSEDHRDRGSGSGVIISESGYILTNHHVVEGATRIEVVLDDKRSYRGTIIGEDPTTDLALIKIQEEGLPAMTFGNSDQVQVGEWVLAVGNPFDLTSTVTAGIVSAKARNIQILRQADGMAVESFIQTDAAVNPGNSGGALVNLRGELIGINTAIATRTGGYAGYSFAVPATLAKKVAEDLLKHGEVQRALLGVSIREVNAQLANEQQIKRIRGVFVASINPGSGAAEAGIKIGDVIVAIDGTLVNTVAALQELVARHRPGERIMVTVDRSGEETDLKVLLKSKNNTLGVVNNVESLEALGADLGELTEGDRRRLNVKGGVKVLRLREGKLKAQKLEIGFVITSVDKRPVYSLSEFKAVLDGKRGLVLLEGFDKEGEKTFFKIDF
jgi:Do/DeqQ family serine protease